MFIVVYYLFQVFSIGYLNFIWLCYTSGDTADKIIIRIFRGDEMEKNPTAERDYEYVVMQELSRRGIISPVICRLLSDYAKYIIIILII